MTKLETRVVHYSKHVPEKHRGGVEVFAQNLKLIFEHVEFMLEGAPDVARVRDEQLMVVCDNHLVTDWPTDIPVVGFQHGVAAVKYEHTRTRIDRRLAKRQARAAKRPNTIWVACAQWISTAFGDLYGNPAEFVIHHHVDLDRFDGRRQDIDNRLLLHDARGTAKGADLVAWLAGQFSEWRFGSLDCEPSAVPDRMRRARAFLHLSRYEGNSVVCNEAMAMNLPCFLTEVGLMRDDNRPRDVWLVDPHRAFEDEKYLEQQLVEFLKSLEQRTYHPREWVVENANLDAVRARWAGVAERWRRATGA